MKKIFAVAIVVLMIVSGCAARAPEVCNQDKVIPPLACLPAPAE